MSSVLSAKQICEQSLGAIGAFPVTDSAADPAQLRRAMTFLDLLLAENAGTNKLLFLIPATVSFTIQNGVGQYDLIDALGADAPADGVQFPIAAYLLTPSGNSVVGLPSTTGVVVGQLVGDLTNPQNVAPSTTVLSINATANQVTLSAPSTVASADLLQFSNIVATAVVTSIGVAGNGATILGFAALPSGGDFSNDFSDDFYIEDALLAIGQGASDQTNPLAASAGTTIASIDADENQVTLSGTTTIAVNDTVQFTAIAASLSATGTVNGPGMVAGTSTFHRHPVTIVKRDMYMKWRYPNENGPPREVYIDRLPDSQIYLYPTPAATDPQMRILLLDVQTYAPNVAPAGVTGTQSQSQNLTNFREAWQRYLIFQLAHDLGSGPIYKLPEQSLNRFGAIAKAARTQLEAFENREHDDVPPVCAPFDDDEYGHGGAYDSDHYLIRL